MNLHIRKASIDDIETLLGWGEELWREELAYEGRLLYAKDEYRVRYGQRIENENSLYLIAEINGKPAGYLYAHIDPSPEYLSGDDLECEIEVVYLEAWSRGQGLAQALIETCLEWAKEKNVKRMKTGIFTENTASLKAFKRCGFEDYHITLVKKME